MVQKSSLKWNMILNSVKGIVTVIFPLVSYPYVLRILGVDAVGMYSFSEALISYFLLFAQLGISNYIISRSGKIKHSQCEMSNFASEVFSINCITTVISLIVLYSIVYFIPALNRYKFLIIVMSITILLDVIGVNWIFSIYEDFTYITLRSIGLCLLSIILLVTMVKNASDLYIYAVIGVISTSGVNFLNYIIAKKYCNIRFTFKIDWRRHLAPILVFFATNVSVIVYVNSDMTILGLICGDYEVGLYTAAARFYGGLKLLLTGIVIATIPRMCDYVDNNKYNLFHKTVTEVNNAIIMIMMPLVIGVIVYSDEIICFVFGNQYRAASSSLRLLSICLPCFIFSYFWGQCVLVPLKKEKVVFISTAVSAAVNIILNIALIPHYKQNAAAFTSIIGEGIAMMTAIIYSNKMGVKVKIWGTLKKSFLGCLFVFAVCMFCKKGIYDRGIKLIISVVISMLGYYYIELLLKNEGMWILKKKKDK